MRKKYAHFLLFTDIYLHLINRRAGSAMLPHDVSRDEHENYIYSCARAVPKSIYTYLRTREKKVKNKKIV